MFHHPSGDPPRGAVFFADEPNGDDDNNNAAAAGPSSGKRKSKLGKQVKSILRRGGSDGSSVSRTCFLLHVIYMCSVRCDCSHACFISPYLCQIPISTYFCSKSRAPSFPCSRPVEVAAAAAAMAVASTTASSDPAPSARPPVRRRRLEDGSFPVPPQAVASPRRSSWARR